MGVRPIMSDDVCKKCGASMHYICPICRKPVEVYSRIVGYMRPIATWNEGKLQEWKDRKEFKDGIKTNDR